jgi:hypothetical protein
MNKYHKIQTVYLRDPENNYKTLLEGQWSKAEFEFLKDLQWSWREKIDGTNIRVRYNCPCEEDPQTGGYVPLEFRGKTDNKSQLQPVLLTRLPEIFTVDDMRKVFEDKTVCLYGEGYGNHIQKAGKFYLTADNDFILFDVKIDNYWLQRKDVELIAERFGIKVVPIVGEGTLEDAIEIVRLGYMSHISEKPQIAEGIVALPKVELFGRNGARIITKIKHKDFRK